MSPKRRGHWLVICNCGWTAEISQQWAKESAKLQPKLSTPGTAHSLDRGAAERAASRA
jgi:hypothetical protein